MKADDLKHWLIWEIPDDASLFVEVGPDGVGLAAWREGERIDFLEMTDEDEDA